MEAGKAEKSEEENQALLQKAVTYTKFDELLDFEADHIFNTNFAKFTEEMHARAKDSEEWHAQFEAINWLRMMNKYHNAKLMENLLIFSIFLKDSVENLRSGISKNALMFTTELF